MRCDIRECDQPAEREVITNRYGKIGSYCLGDARKVYDQNYNAFWIEVLGWHAANAKAARAAARRSRMPSSNRYSA